MELKNISKSCVPVLVALMLCSASTVTAEENAEKEQHKNNQSTPQTEKQQKTKKQQKDEKQLKDEKKQQEQKKLQEGNQQKPVKPQKPQERVRNQQESQKTADPSAPRRSTPNRNAPSDDSAPRSASPQAENPRINSPGGNKSVRTPTGPDSKQPTPVGAHNAGRGRPVYTLPPNHNAAQADNGTLAKKHGDDILHQVNSARARLPGVNAKRFPSGQVSVRSDGGLNLKASGGRNYQVRPDGTIASFSQRGTIADFRPDGKLRSLQVGGLQIKRGAHSERSIVTVRPDKSLLISTGPRSGYLQRSVVLNHKSFVQRSFVFEDRSYTRVYGTYAYRGVAMQYYLPQAYYPPVFYGWANAPWSAPVRYSWRWQRDPWYDAYNGYFAPLPVYRTPALWLADYLLAETLRAAYLERGEGYDAAYAPNAADEAALTPKVRALIAREIKQQLARERRAAERPGQAGYYGQLSTAMLDRDLLFVVTGNLEVAAGDAVCTLTAGDVLQLDGFQPEAFPDARVRVLGSKPYDCPPRAVVAVPLHDLQEMHNSMRERIYQGLEVLRGGNGSNGIPAAPREALSAPAVTEAYQIRASDENVLAALQVQREDADQAEQQAIQSAFSDDHIADQPADVPEREIRP